MADKTYVLDRVDFLKHLDDFISQIPYGGSSMGTTDTYLLEGPAITELREGMGVSFKVHRNSTGAAKLKWGNTPEKNILKDNGNAVTNLKNGGIYTVRYDGTNYRLLGDAAEGDALAADILSGKIATTDVGVVTGTMPSPASGNALSYTRSETSLRPIPSLGYWDGIRYTQITDANFVAANIVSGKSIFGLAGTSGSDGTAVAADILATKIAYVAGTKITGTMVNQGAVTNTLATNSAAYTIPAGYHSGTGKVTATITNLTAANVKSGTTVGGVLGTYAGDATAAAADLLLNKTAYVGANKITGTKDLTNLTAANIKNTIVVGGITGTFANDATAVAGDILATKTAYSGANKLTGSMTNRGAVAGSITTNAGTYTVAAGYHDGTGKVTASITNLTAANVKSGTTVGGVLGTYAGDATAVAADILTSKTAYVGANKVTGNMTNRGAVNGSITTNAGTYTVAVGYHDGGGKVTANITNLIAANIKSGVTVGGVAGTYSPGLSGHKFAAVDLWSHALGYGSYSTVQGTWYDVVITGIAFQPTQMIAVFYIAGPSGPYVIYLLADGCIWNRSSAWHDNSNSPPVRCDIRNVVFNASGVTFQGMISGGFAYIGGFEAIWDSALKRNIGSVSLYG